MASWNTLYAESAAKKISIVTKFLKGKVVYKKKKLLYPGATVYYVILCKLLSFVHAEVEQHERNNGVD